MLDISSELIDFDRVLMGCSRRMYIRLHNTSLVTANFSFRRSEGKDEPKIILSPNVGSIRAGRKTIVCI
jgi:hypothetical protein